MGHLIDSRTPDGKEKRRLIVGTVLATDMSWHFEWVERFGRAVKERKRGVAPNTMPTPIPATSSSGTTTAWKLSEEELEVEVLSPDEADREDRLFLCQALMKCADISNPARPHAVSKHWSTVLLEEWAAQALLERHLGLPVSVVAEANEKVQAAGQVGFIKLFTQPLLEAATEAFPGA